MKNARNAACVKYFDGGAGVAAKRWHIKLRHVQNQLYNQRELSICVNVYAPMIQSVRAPCAAPRATEDAPVATRQRALWYIMSLAVSRRASARQTRDPARRYVRSEGIYALLITPRRGEDGCLRHPFAIQHRGVERALNAPRARRKKKASARYIIADKAMACRRQRKTRAVAVRYICAKPRVQRYIRIHYSAPGKCASRKEI